MPLTLVRTDYGYPVDKVLSFKAGALSASLACAIGYLLYTWFAG